MATDLRQTHFRFGKEELLEATHGWWQNEDIDHTQLITADWAFLLRFVEQEVGGTAAANTDAQFQYNKNGAGWVDITTTSSVVKAVASVAFTNGQACTKRLSGTGTFETSGAGCTEDGSSGGTANDIAASGNSETEAGLQIVYADVANGDTIQFLFRSPDWTIIYIITPTLTIQKGETELLAGICSLVVTSSGNFNRLRNFVGVTVITLLSVGDLIVTQPFEYLAGVASIALTSTGNLIRTRLLAGTTAITVGATGVLGLIKLLAGISSINLSSSGLLRRIRSLAGSATITCYTTGNLVIEVVRYLAGIANIVLTSRGQIIVWRLLPITFTDIPDSLTCNTIANTLKFTDISDSLEFKEVYR